MEFPIFIVHDKPGRTWHFNSENEARVFLWGRKSDAWAAYRRLDAREGDEGNIGAALDDPADEIERLKAEVERLKSALAPFASFLGWIEAGVETGDVEPLDDNTCVTSLSVGGGSHYLWVADLRRAAELLGGWEPKGVGF